MKILRKNDGALTNVEVLEFLRSRGASADPTRVLASIHPSEFQVYDYLVQSCACNITRENIHEFLQKCEKFDLAKAEILNIINIRPAELAEMDSILEKRLEKIGDDFVNTRYTDEELEELVKLTVEVLPAPVKPGVTADETSGS